MLKRSISFLLAVMMVISMLPVSAFAEETTEEIVAETASQTATETVSESVPEETRETIPEETKIPETSEAETEAAEEESTEETAAAETAETVAFGEEAMLAAAGVKDETYLQQVYDEPYAAVECDVVMVKNFTWGKDYRFKMNQGITLTVTRGTTLTLNGSADIRGTILVESGATLILNARFNLFSGGTLRVEQGGTVEVRNGSYTISCDTDGILDIRGSIVVDGDPNESKPWVDVSYQDGMWATVSGVPTSYIRAVCLVDTQTELRGVLTMQEGAAYNSFLVSIGEDISLTEDLGIRDNTMSGSCVVKIDGDATVTIQKGVTLTNTGTFSVNDGTIRNEGKIVSDGWISVNDTFVNNGTMELRSGRISVGSQGVFENKGKVQAGSNVKVDISGSWNGPEPEFLVRNEYYLQELLDGSDPRPVMGTDVILNNDFTIAGDIQRLNIDATLTVPAGKTLTIDRAMTTFVNSNGAIVVEKGGTLIINSVVSCWGNSRVENYGTIKKESNDGHVIINHENGGIATFCVGIPKDMLWLRFVINRDADLQNAVQMMKKTDYVRYILLVHGDIDLSADVTIPANAMMTLADMPSTMTIPAGKKLTNNGELIVGGSQTVCNYGVIENNNYCSINGQMNNQGTFRENGALYINGRWEGHSAVMVPWTQTDLENAIKNNGGGYYLNREVILDRELKITGWLEVGFGGRLIIPKGKKLTVEANANLVVSPGGYLEVNGSYELKKNADGWKSAISLNTENDQVGTVIGVKDADLQPNGFVYNAANFSKVMQMVERYPNAEYTFVYVYTDVELPEDITIPANCLFHLYNGAQLTVPQGRTLTNKGQFHCWEGQKVKNLGTIDNRYFFLFQGSLYNEGQMHLQPGSYLIVDGSGYVSNTGSVDAYGQGTAENLGVWEGKTINRHYITQAELEQMLAETAVSGGVVTLDKGLTLETNLTIPDNVQLNIYGGKLVVPDSVKLVLNGQGVHLYKGGIQVQQGGKLELNTMIFMEYDGVLEVEGSFLSEAGDGDNVVRFYEYGAVPCTVTGVPMEKQRLYVMLRDQEQYWLPGIEQFENNDYSKVFLEILNDVTLPKDLVIPENGYLLIEGMAQKLTIPQGVTLTNYGVLRIDEAKSIYNYGTIENRGYFYVRANLFNYGNLELLAGGSMEMPRYGYVLNKGEANISGGSRLTMAEGCLWEGSEPVWHFITQDQLEANIAAAAERGETYILNTDVTLERNLTLTNPLVIGNGGYLQVPEGVTLNIQELLNVFVGGRLEVKGKYTVAGNGQVGVRYEKGQFSSQAIGIQNKHLWVNMLVLEEQDLRDGVQLMQTGGYGLGSLAIYADVSLTGDITIPANAIIPVENGAELTVPAGVTLTNHGSLYVWEGTKLINNGTIRNHKDLFLYGQMTNNGSLELPAAKKGGPNPMFLIGKTGSIWNMGQASLMQNSCMELLGEWMGIWPPEVNGAILLPHAKSLTIEGDETILVDLRQESGFTVQIHMPGVERPILTWTTDDCNGKVLDLSGMQEMGNGMYYFPLVGPGKAKLTVKANDGSNLLDSITVEAEWADWSPRLGNNTLTLNPMLSEGAQVALIPSYGNEILSCWFEDSRFTGEYDEENAVLVVNTVGEMKNSSVSTKLYVTCADGETYAYQVKLAVKNTVPSVTVKQSGKLDLFYTDSQAALTVTAKNADVTAVELTDTADFCLEDGVLCFSDYFVKDYLNYPQLKPDTKATVKVYLEGYRFPVTKAITIGTATSKLTLTTVPASSVVYSVPGSDLTAVFQVMNKSTKEPLNLESGHVQSLEAAFVDRWMVEEGSVQVRLAGQTGGTVTLWVQLDNWMKAVKVTHKITVDSKLPTVKAAESTLKLSSTFPGQTARTAITLSHSNLEIACFENDNVFVSAEKEGSPAWKEAEKLQVFYDGTNIVAKIKDPSQLPKAGTYKFSAVPVVGEATLKALAIKVSVSATLPKVKLGSSTVKLNTLLSGEEVGSVQVTMTNTTGYELRLVGFQILEPFFDYVDITMDDDILMVRLLTQREAKYPHTLIPVVEDDQGTQVKLPALKLTVQSYEKEISVSQTGKGSLDAIARKNGIVYTIGKITNALGAVESVELEKGSEWFELSALSTDAKGKQTFALALKEDAEVSVKKSYEVQFRYTICGKEVLSKPVMLKVKESALKVTVPTVNWYCSQQRPLAVRLDVANPAGVQMDAVAINAKTSKELHAAIGAADFSAGVLKLEIANPGSLIPGKSYKLVLDVTPVGHAQDAKATQITVTIKVAK